MYSVAATDGGLSCRRLCIMRLRAQVAEVIGTDATFDCCLTATDASTEVAKDFSKLSEVSQLTQHRCTIVRAVPGDPNDPCCPTNAGQFQGVEFAKGYKMVITTVLRIPVVSALVSDNSR